MALQDYFDTTILIEEAIKVPNGFGGFAEYWAGDITFADADFTWGSVNGTWAGQTEVLGLIDYITGRKEQIARQFQEDSTHIMMANKDVSISITNRVRADGKIYRVLHVDTPFKKHKEVLLQYVGVDNAVANGHEYIITSIDADFGQHTEICIEKVVV